MARAVQNAVLARSGLQNAVLASIDETLGARADWYQDVLWKALKAPSEDKTILWLKFVLTAHYIQSATLQRRLTQLIAIVDALEGYLAQRSIPLRGVPALIDAVNGLQVRNGTYRKQAGVSEQVAKFDLAELASCGLLEAHGERRWRHYRAASELRNIARATRPRFAELDPFDSPGAEPAAVSVPSSALPYSDSDPRN